MGSGVITANGGNAGFNNADWGSGGGGRIAVYAASFSLLPSQITARAGMLGNRGGAGSIYMELDGQTPTLRYDNGGVGGRTNLSGEFALSGDLLITGGASLSHAMGDDSLRLDIDGDVIIDVDSSINVSVRGYGPGEGPGSVPWNGASQCGAAGAGHGGTGGDFGCDSTRLPNTGGSVYGSAFQPTMRGSGGAGYRGNVLASSGGGVVRLIVSGSLLINGSVMADGGTLFCGSSNCVGPGAGAGGSIWIDAGSVTGSGVISANGGNAGFINADWGSGGGGRIAVYAASSSLLPSQITARAGMLGNRGGAGSIYMELDGQTPTLRYDNGGVGGTTELTGHFIVNGDLLLSGGAVLGHGYSDDSLHMIVSGDVLIDSTSRIDVSGRGYAGGEGPGSVPWNGNVNCGSAGAGHGGTGGDFGCSASVSVPDTGGAVYGSAFQPATMGSGGAGYGGNVLATSGGGVIRLLVSGSLIVDGTVMANGGFQSNKGAGAGGSIWIDAGSVTGSGVISANGGNAGFNNAGWGSGGGGRIAVYTCDFQMPVSNVVAEAGLLGNRGQPGTIFFGSGTIQITQQPVGVSLLPGEGFSLQAAANTSQPDEQLTYQWRKKDSTGAFLPLIEGQDGGRYTGVETPTLMVSNSTCTDSGEYDCLVIDSCGSFPTQAVSVAVVQVGDIANDFGFTVNEGGGPDGVVDFGDFVALLGLIGPCPGGVPGCLGDIANDFGFTAADGGGPDGQIDFGDFVALLGLIGPCP